MFFHMTLDRYIVLHPAHFGPRMREILYERLRTEVEGTCSGRYGFIVMVTDIKSVGEGVIQDTTAFAKFHVTYTCIVFRPFKGEVLDCIVTSVNKMGFFAEAGPLQVFVSSYLIPEDLSFQAIDEPCYVSADEQVRIQKDGEVRLRIVGIRNDANEIFCVATLKDNYLGLIANAFDVE